MFRNDVILGYPFHKNMTEKPPDVDKEQNLYDSQSQGTLTKNVVSSRLSDVGSYSYSALCAVSLYHLFEDEWHREFKKTTLQMIFEHLQVPDQVSSSVEAIMCGHGLDDPKPFVDTVLKEECLDKSGLPLVTDMVTLAIAKGCYDSRMRVLIKYMAWQLRVSWEHLEDVETIMAETLEAQQYSMSEEEMNEKKKKSRKDKVKRFALIGLATIGGGTLIGLTGGLAAPLVAAGAGAIIGGAGAAALGTTAGVAIIGSLFGVAGAGLAGFKMNKRVGAIEEFNFEPLVWGGGSLRTQTIGKQLHITIAVTGWLTNDMQDFKVPWRSLSESKEQYCLRWESKYLVQLGTAFDYILSGVMSVATQEALKYTVLSGIMAAIAWPGVLISAASVIDNPWSVCIQRSTAAGKALAEVLLAREQGNRPVTLAGFSLGARVIFSCLEELAKRKGSEGIVEDVVLLGAPVTGNPKEWKKLTRVVAGKIINGYCRGDWLLKFLYRTASVQFTTIAGLSPVKWDDRRMHNIDLSDVVTGHMDYMKQLDTIMKVVGVRTKDDVSIRDTSQTLKNKVTKDSSSSSLAGSTSTTESPLAEGYVTPSRSLDENNEASASPFANPPTTSASTLEETSVNCSNRVNHGNVNSDNDWSLLDNHNSYSSLELTDSDPENVEDNSRHSSDSDIQILHDKDDQLSKSDKDLNGNNSSDSELKDEHISENSGAIGLNNLNQSDFPKDCSDNLKDENSCNKTLSEISSASECEKTLTDKLKLSNNEGGQPELSQDKGSQSELSKDKDSQSELSQHKENQSH